MKKLMFAVLLTISTFASGVSAQQSVSPLRLSLGVTSNFPKADGVDLKAKAGFRLGLGKEYFVNPDAMLDLYAVSSLVYSHERFEVKSEQNDLISRHKLAIPVSLGLSLRLVPKVRVFLEAGLQASYTLASKSKFEHKRLLFGGTASLGVNAGNFYAALGTDIGSNKNVFTFPKGKSGIDRAAHFSVGVKF